MGHLALDTGSRKFIKSGFHIKYGMTKRGVSLRDDPPDGGEAWQSNDKLHSNKKVITKIK